MRPREGGAWYIDDMIGKVYGDLTVYGRDDNFDGMVLCRCRCGRSVRVYAAHLKNGSRRMCDKRIHARLEREKINPPARYGENQKMRKFLYIIINQKTDETEAVFDSIQDTADYLGISISGVSHLVHRGSKRVLRVEKEDDDYLE